MARFGESQERPEQPDAPGSGPRPASAAGAYRVAIFARNEAKRIGRAIESVIADVPRGSDLRVHVLINGCTDSTPRVVEACAARWPGVVDATELPLGDKCNAWNAYVHRIADDAPVHFFMDGDVWAASGSIPRMQAAILGNPRAAAIGGVPLAGRNRSRLLRLMLERKWVYGNLYAVRYETLAHVRSLGIRLPLGLMGNDCFITHLLKACLPDRRRFDDERIIHEPGCGFGFRPLQPFSPADARIYLKRMVTYRLREHQLRHLGWVHLDGVPATMDGVNGCILDELRHARRPLDIAVRRRLRRQYGERGTLPFYGERLKLAA